MGTEPQEVDVVEIDFRISRSSLHPFFYLLLQLFYRLIFPPLSLSLSLGSRMRMRNRADTGETNSIVFSIPYYRPISPDSL